MLFKRSDRDGGEGRKKRETDQENQKKDRGEGEISIVCLSVQ